MMQLLLQSRYAQLALLIGWIVVLFCLVWGVVHGDINPMILSGLVVGTAVHTVHTNKGTSP